jgi:hypothetical protein
MIVIKRVKSLDFIELRLSPWTPRPMNFSQKLNCKNKNNVKDPEGAKFIFEPNFLWKRYTINENC